MFRWLGILSLLSVTCTSNASDFSYDTTRVNNLYDSVWVNFDKKDYNKTTFFSEEIIDCTKGSEYKKLKNIYNLLLVIYSDQGRFSEALNYGRFALCKSDDMHFNANINTNIGTVYADVGDYTRAINYHNKALNEVDSNDVVLKAYIYNNIGYAYSKVEIWEKAIVYYLKSIEIKERFIKDDLINSYYNCAWAYFNLGDNRNAEYYFELSIRNHEKVFGFKNSETAISYVNYIDFLTQISKYEEAIAYYKKADNILKNTIIEKHLYSFLFQKNGGNLYLSKGNYNEALGLYQKALISKIYNFNDTNIFHNPSPDEIPDINLIEILKYKSQAFEKYYEQTGELKYIEASFQTLELCVKYIEKLRIGFLTEYSKLTLSSNEREIYMSLIRISNKLYEITGDKNYLNKAFEFSERSKYGVLREVRNDFYSRNFAGVPDSITERERQLKEKITFIQLKIEKDQGNENLNRELFSLISEQETLIDKIEKGYPQYFRAKYENKIAGPEEIKTKLKKNQALVEYSISDSTIYIFTITKDTFLLVTRKADSVFYKNLNQYKKYLHSNYALEYNMWRKPSYYLYEQLILPVEKFIKGKDLVIVPDENLGKIAFECLTTQPFKENIWRMYQDEPYLLYEYPVGYSFSATLFAEELPVNKKRKIFAGFAPDYNNSIDSLPSMPETLSDIRKIALMFFGKSFAGEKASKNNFFSSADKYRIVHFYSHGLEDTINPSMSKMFLSGESDDRYLYSYEVSNLKIDADLVVLLSCYSGSGNVSKGEGVMSLGRSFFNGGSRSMIISLWSASTYHSMDIIKEFYKNLLKGKNKTRALQLAKIKFLKKATPIGADPQNWASIVIVGKQDAMFKPLWVKFGVGLAVLIFLILLFVYRKRLVRHY